MDPFNVYFNTERPFVLYSRRKVLHPQGIPRTAACNDMAFELSPEDMQGVDLAEWVAILKGCGCIDVDTLATLDNQHVVAHNRFWFVDARNKRSQSATETAAADVREFYMGPERFVEVRSPDELEHKVPGFAPIASVFDLV
ncbi:hypothetical protein ACQKWADRAFT_314508 [Trichoderma austrokoningii]